MESVVDPPVIPIINRPPFLGTEARAVPASRAGETAAARPRAETWVINCLLLILFWLNNLVNFDSSDMLISFSFID
jgi:hypothetical protein